VASGSWAGAQKCLLNRGDRACRRLLSFQQEGTFLVHVRHALRGAETLAILRAVNPIVRGWSAYYRTVVSKEVFASLDSHLWQLTYRWALHRHPKKSKHWITSR
jgi:hypothetical protein